MKYEICYLVGESNDSKSDQIKKEVEEMITKEGGVFFGIETIDRRKLAYKVEKDTRGIYVTRRFEFPETEEEKETNPLANLNKKLNLYGDILRFLIIKADELPELKQREIPVKAERGGQRFDRSRSNSPMPIRRETAPKIETKPLPEKVEKKEESIDKKLDELLNI